MAERFTGNTMNTNDTRLEVSVGYAATIGDSFTIVNNTTANAVNGNFTSLAGAIAEGGHFTAPGGHTFRLTYTGGDGNDVVITKVTPPPAVFGTLILTSGTGPEAGMDIVTATATGAAGLSHVLEASTSLSAWAALQSLTSTAAGPLSFRVTQTPGIPRRFFRIRTL